MMLKLLTGLAARAWRWAFGPRRRWVPAHPDGSFPSQGEWVEARDARHKREGAALNLIIAFGALEKERDALRAELAAAEPQGYPRQEGMGP
jgi:hypothetical protein